MVLFGITGFVRRVVSLFVGCPSYRWYRWYRSAYGGTRPLREITEVDSARMICDFGMIKEEISVLLLERSHYDDALTAI
jgi:hypothetical protein